MRVSDDQIGFILLFVAGSIGLGSNAAGCLAVCECDCEKGCPEIPIDPPVCTPEALNDGNPCTEDTCNYGGPNHSALPDGSDCGNGDPCVRSICKAGICSTDAPAICGGEDVCSNGRCAKICSETTKHEYPTGKGPSTIVAVDVNGDGWMDLATGGAGNVTVMLNDGSGAFNSNAEYQVNSDVSSMLSADFDGNGWPDLAVLVANASMSGENPISVLFNQGDGTFSDKKDYFFGGDAFRDIAAADLNGDGMVDLAATSDNSYAKVVVLQNDGQGGFALQSEHAITTNDAPPVPGNLYSIRATDLNGDNHLDLAVSTSFRGIYALFNDGMGGFENLTEIGPLVQAQYMNAADLNGDGAVDFVFISAGNVIVMLNDGAGKFQMPTSHTQDGGITMVVAADVDGDGMPDLVTADSAWNGVSVLHQGNGTFGPPIRYLVGTNPISVVVADLTGDGKPELTTTNFFDQTVTIVHNECISASP